MKSIYLILVSALFSLSACRTMQTDLDLNDLTDMTTYTGGMLVNCETYMGHQVTKILLNGSEIDNPDVMDLTSAGYYRIEIYLNRTDQTIPGVIRIVILDPERGNADWGLPPWTPAAAETGEIGVESVRLVYPPAVPSGSSVPLIVLIGDELLGSDQNLDAEAGSVRFRIKRGVGSAQVPAKSAGSAIKIDNQSFPMDINTINSAPLLLSGVLPEDLDIPAGSYINISDDLTIPEGRLLTIGSGTFMIIDPGVNIYNHGSISMGGTADAPVSVTCSNDGSWWGGFISTMAGNEMEAHFTIFCRSGSHSGGSYDWGHAHRQALFYMEDGAMLLDHCYMIDHVGQIFYPVSSDLSLTDCLVQRAKTGGQMNQSELVMERCVFTDFPDDSYIYRDEDNDGLYLNETNATINHSIFMYAKDDGLDSGASGGGVVSVTNSRFESNFHEGAALSSGNNVTKLHTISNCIFTNCGQGLELGYSSPYHLAEVDSCSFIANGIGIRYGDCYDFPHHGYIHVSNSESLENSWHDVWNMNREHWAADTSHMSFDHVTVTKSYSLYPELIIYEN